MTETLSPTQRARAKAAASFAAVNAAGLAMDQLAAEARARTGRTPRRGGNSGSSHARLKSSVSVGCWLRLHRLSRSRVAAQSSCWDFS